MFEPSTEVALHLRAIFDRLFTLLAGTTFVNTQRAVFDVIVHCVELLAGKRGNPSHREALNIYINDVFDTQNDELYKIIIDQATEMHGSPSKIFLMGKKRRGPKASPIID